MLLAELIPAPRPPAGLSCKCRRGWGREHRGRGPKIHWVGQGTRKSMGGWGWELLEHKAFLKSVIALFCFLGTRTMPLK